MPSRATADRHWEAVFENEGVEADWSALRLACVSAAMALVAALRETRSQGGVHAIAPCADATAIDARAEQ